MNADDMLLGSESPHDTDSDTLFPRRAFYQDGKLVPAAQGGSSVEPKPSAANDGTMITASAIRLKQGKHADASSRQRISSIMLHSGGRASRVLQTSIIGSSMWLRSTRFTTQRCHSSVKR